MRAARPGVSWLAALCLWSLAGAAPLRAQPRGPEEPFAWERLKSLWRGRIEATRGRGQAPLIDLESTYNDLTIDPQAFARRMDADGVTLSAMSPELFGEEISRYARVWPASVHRLVEAVPDHFIPVPNADLERVLRWSAQDPQKYLDDLFANILRDRYPMMGEFMVASYPSNDEYADFVSSSSVAAAAPEIHGFPIEGPLAERIFGFSQEHGIPFQIHYEVEDARLAPLERMLAKYPGAQVIWCHVGRVRRQERTRTYGPAYVRRLIQKYPNLYFDLSGNAPRVSYPGSPEFASRLWAPDRKHLEKDWARLIVDFPWRFLAGLDLGGDRMTLKGHVAGMRRLLDELPPQTREIVAYRAAWKLLFKEDL
ncbi:MAG: amidohydrolase family protein [Elusimicrobia bacterium]|nr:amidohydrolase family protein [Elusimicrobiota bacterium]